MKAISLNFGLPSDGLEPTGELDSVLSMLE